MGIGEFPGEDARATRGQAGGVIAEIVGRRSFYVRGGISLGSVFFGCRRSNGWGNG